MLMQKDVSFDPGIGAIQVPTVVLARGDDVVDKMHDRRRSIAAGEIDDIVVANRSSKKVPAKNPMPARLNSARAVIRLKASSRLRKITVADHKRRIVQ